MDNLDTGVISLLIASATLLIGLFGYSRIQRNQLAREFRAKNEQTQQLAAETRQMRDELTALTAEISELRRLLTEAA
ncbi:hypothetical protein ABT337_07960 [Saccharopolyspora hirsuta]|uniref:Uncharacterized protein n=1 Tax=Saccharopolyspora hirsuta TaxID=1837 RepID=A0A5M7CA01_SACHI|nr:hypothetical protein [Saccharopolyspora hirsuta]KAA5835175.1 hypothetical protein F1721_10325 [Saccharopolyspora hirsuta]